MCVCVLFHGVFVCFRTGTQLVAVLWWTMPGSRHSWSSRLSRVFWRRQGSVPMVSNQIVLFSYFVYIVLLICVDFIIFVWRTFFKPHYQYLLSFPSISNTVQHFIFGPVLFCLVLSFFSYLCVACFRCRFSSRVQHDSRSSSDYTKDPG